MALPVVVTGVAGLPGHHPPAISSGGNVYTVVRQLTAVLEVAKATDPEVSFTLTDSANRPIHLGTIIGYAVKQVADVLHIIAWSATPDYEYYTFNMATDLWAIDELMVNAGGADSPEFPFASFDVRGDGDVIVEYAGGNENIMGTRHERVVYARREATVWTVGIAVDDGGEFHYGNPVMVKGPLTDDMHMGWQRMGPIPAPPVAWSQVEVRTLDPANVFSTKVVSFACDSADAMLGFVNAVSYDDSGTQRVNFHGGYELAGVSRKTSLQGSEDGSDDITLDICSQDLTPPDVFINGDLPIITLAVLGTDLHRLLSGGGAEGVDQDIFYETASDGGTNWGIDTEEIDGITCNFISGIIYERAGNNRFAYLYDESGTQVYNEKDLGSASTNAIAADVDMAFTIAPDLKAPGQVDAAVAMALSLAPDLLAAGALDVDVDMALSLVADLKATGKMDAAVATALTLVADLKAAGQVDAAVALQFSIVADVKDAVSADAIAAAVNMAITLAPDLKSAGQVDAAVALAFQAIANLKAAGQLDAAAALAFALSVDLKATGQLSASLAMLFSTVATLTSAGKLDAVAAMVFTAAADLTAAGKMDAAVNLAFTLAPDLQAPSADAIDALVAMSFILSADLKAKGQLDVAPAMIFSLSPDLRSLGSLAASPAMAFALSPALEGAGSLGASPAMAFGISAGLDGPGNLEANPAMAFALAPDLQAAVSNSLNASVQMNFSVNAALLARGSLVAAVLLQFSLSAILIDGTVKSIPNSVQDLVVSLLNSFQNLQAGTIISPTP